MKKIIMITACALLLAVTATYAQTDTTGTRRSTTSPTVSPQPNPAQQQQPAPTPAPTPPPGQNYQKDMTRIQATDVPTGMRQTLQDPAYKGWENSSIYKSNNNDGYLLQMNNSAGQIQTYRFDADGKLVPTPKQ